MQVQLVAKVCSEPFSEQSCDNCSKNQMLFILLPSNEGISYKVTFFFQVQLQKDFDPILSEQRRNPSFLWENMWGDLMIDDK